MISSDSSYLVNFPGNLSPVTFADADPSPILARLVKKYEADSGKTLYPGDPERLLLNTAAYELAVAYGLLDFTGKQNLLAYTSAAFEDHVGAFHAVERLAASSARATQRFYAEPGLAFPVPVPETLRVSPDNQLFFKVTRPAVIPAAASLGERPFVDAAVECLTPGEGGNGFEPGQINVLVDPQPFIAATENIETSAGGKDIEDDERYRKRIYLAPGAFSTAGPEGAYEYWAYTASQAISDVAVISPKPCFIEVYPLLDDGALPDQALLDLVAETLAPRDRRPMGDWVGVLAPVPVEYSIEAEYYVSRECSGKIESIAAAVAQAGRDYAAWQRAKLGRDIVPEELSRLMRAAGAKRTVIASPAFTAIERRAVARAASITLNFAGFEDA
ncbi:MAG: baseplate J/gp47 family protein [Candidatus Adiutrix sp.]|jgi:phage-related baseplate assembly protein|nr:baseplate J/gp47 family protein [Candidatus Adiutrix sp.]